MLKFTWIAKHTGAPASRSWQQARDMLYLGGGSRDPVVQDFPRAGWSEPRPGDALTQAVAGWRDRRGVDGPVVVMVHGWNFDPHEGRPAKAADDPYQLVFGPPDPERPGESWLPLVDPAGDGARAVAFAWTSIGSQTQAGNAGWSNFYQYPVLDLAPLAARALATVVLALGRAGLAVDLLAHSLGTRTALQALGMLGRAGHGGVVGQAVLLGGAEFCCDAQANLEPVTTQVFNLVNRDDPVLKLGAEEMCHPYRPKGTPAALVIGRQGAPAARWLDIQLDSPEVAAWYAGKGYGGLSGEPCDGRGAHWAYYHQPGNRALVADLLARRLDPGWFAGAPAGVHPCDYRPVAVPSTPSDAATRVAMNDPNPPVPV